MKTIQNTKTTNRFGGIDYAMSRIVQGVKYGVVVSTTPTQPRQSRAYHLRKARLELKLLSDPT